MHTTDIQRLRVQIRRVADKADEIIEEADTIGDAGFDPSQSETILQKQQELTTELAQAVSDFNELTSRAERVESDRIQYKPASDSLSVSHDSKNSTVTIDYSGAVTVPQSEVTVTKAGTEITPFGGDVSSGASVSIDVSGLSEGDSVSVEMVQHRIQTGYQIRPWEEILGQTDATAPTIDAGSLTLPEHNLTQDTQTLTRTVTLGQSI